MKLSAEIYLGDDGDCETCGSSYNSLAYSYDTDTGLHDLNSTIGCYGGEGKEAVTDLVAVSFISEYLDYPARDELIELIDWIDSLDR